MTSYWQRFKRLFSNNIDKWPDFLGFVMLGLGLIVFLSEYFGWSFLYIPILSDLLLRIWPELIGIGLAVIIIDNANELIRLREEKKRLILQMGSPDNGVAIEAVRQLRARGWLEDGSLRGAYLVEADLRKAELWFADLNGANLMESNLAEAELRGAKLMEADLNGAVLIGADLGKSKLQKANLENAKLEDANLEHANLEGANLSEADLREADLWEANFTSVNLESANLTRANLSEAHLIFTKMGRAIMDGVNLNGAEILSVDFKDSTITTEQLASAIILDGKPLPDGIPRGIGSIMPDGTVYNPETFKKSFDEHK